MRSILSSENGQGELPLIDLDPRNIGKKITAKTNRKLLTGEYTSNGGNDDKLIRAFRESKLSVDKFLKELELSKKKP